MVQTGAKIQSGGAILGKISVWYQLSTDDEVKYPANKPTASHRATPPTNCPSEGRDVIMET